MIFREFNPEKKVQQILGQIYTHHLMEVSNTFLSRKSIGVRRKVANQLDHFLAKDLNKFCLVKDLKRFLVRL